MIIKAITASNEMWNKVKIYADSCSWKAGKSLANAMMNNGFKDWERVIVALNDDEICGYCTVAITDCIPDVHYTPYIGYLFVDEKWRGNRLSQRLIIYSMSYLKSVGFDKEGNEITFLDILKTPKPDFAMDIHNKNNVELLKKYFNILTEQEKEIIIKRYGLNNNDEVTQKEIAKDLKISRSYVSRIEKRALTKMLREFIKNKNHTE